MIFELGFVGRFFFFREKKGERVVEVEGRVCIKVFSMMLVVCIENCTRRELKCFVYYVKEIGFYLVFF